MISGIYLIISSYKLLFTFHKKLHVSWLCITVLPCQKRSPSCPISANGISINKTSRPSRAERSACPTQSTPSLCSRTASPASLLGHLFYQIREVSFCANCTETDSRDGVQIEGLLLLQEIINNISVIW